MTAEPETVVDLFDHQPQGSPMMQVLDLTIHHLGHDLETLSDTELLTMAIRLQSAAARLDRKADQCRAVVAARRQPLANN